MSSVYALEPATSGVVVLHTTVGDVEIELWAKETPLACKNFVQHCIDGYYTGCIFHRIVKDFIIQTGDPTGTGDGGEAAYGEPFPLEIHSRLRFSHRGVVAMASSDKGNASQFFFLVGQQAEQLNRKHTIFGKVAGATIFNLLKLNDADVGTDDRPLFPARITGAELLQDPFEGALRPRVTRAQAEAEAQAEAAERRKPRATRNAALLSFGADEEEEEAAPSGGRMRARQHFSGSKEVREDAARLAAAEEERRKAARALRKEEERREAAAAEAERREAAAAAGRSFDEEMRARMRRAMPAASPPSADRQEGGGDGEGAAKQPDAAEEERLAGKKRKKRAGLRVLEEQRSKYRRRSKEERQARALEKLQAFQQSLRKEAEEAQPEREKEVEEKEEEEQEAERYSARLMYGKALDEEESDAGWKAHRLKFTRTLATPQDDDYVVIDTAKAAGDRPRDPSDRRRGGGSGGGWRDHDRGGDGYGNSDRERDRRGDGRGRDRRDHRDHRDHRSHRDRRDDGRERRR